MKKIFTLFLMLVAGTTFSFAQGVDNILQFTDKEGNVLEDGSTVTRNDVVSDGFDESMINADISVINTSTEEQTVYVKWNITRIDGGTVQTCFGSCTRQTAVGEYTTHSVILQPGESLSLATEWILPEDAKEGQTCIVTYQIVRVKGLTEHQGSKVTVNYVNGKSASIDNADADRNLEVVERYNANGQRVNANTKGVNIIKLSNGKTLKSINY